MDVHTDGQMNITSNSTGRSIRTSLGDDLKLTDDHAVMFHVHMSYGLKE